MHPPSINKEDHMTPEAEKQLEEMVGSFVVEQLSKSKDYSPRDLFIIQLWILDAFKAGFLARNRMLEGIVLKDNPDWCDACNDYMASNLVDEIDRFRGEE